MVGYDIDNKRFYYSIKGIHNLIGAKNKAKQVVESCICEEHLEVAKNYIKLYSQATEDMIGVQELNYLLTNKTNELC